MTLDDMKAKCFELTKSLTPDELTDQLKASIFKANIYLALAGERGKIAAWKFKQALDDFDREDYQEKIDKAKAECSVYIQLRDLFQEWLSEVAA